MLKIENMSYMLKNKKFILNNVSFEIDASNILGILGPSGAGKSTLLNCITGINQSTNGEIYLSGLNLTHAEIYKRNISYLQQSFPLYSTLSVKENILLKRQKDIPPFFNIESMFYEFGLELDLLDRDIANLSGGEQQRIALIKCLIQKRKILLLDEPFSNIDKYTKNNIAKYVTKYIKENDVICLLVSHDENDLIRLSDYIIYLSDGKILQQGETNNVLNNPEYGKITSIGKIDGVQSFHKSTIEPNMENKTLPDMLRQDFNMILWGNDAMSIIDSQKEIGNSESINDKLYFNVKVIEKKKIFNRTLIKLAMKNNDGEIWYNIPESKKNFDLLEDKVTLEVDLKSVKLVDNFDKIIKSN